MNNTKMITNIEDESKIKDIFKSLLLSYNEGEFEKNFTFELHNAIECFYSVMMYSVGIPNKPFGEYLHEINQSPELIGRAHRIILSLKEEIQEVKSLFEGETPQK